MMSTLSMPFTPVPTFFTPSPNATSTFTYSTAQPVSKRKRSPDATNDETTDSSSEEESSWLSSSHAPATPHGVARTSPSRVRDGRPLKRIRRDPVGSQDDNHMASSGQAEFRNAGMETGFAELSLMPGLEAVTGWSRGQTQVEPSALRVDVHDVKMASRSWYEPEKDRIIVFDLNDSDAESEAGDSHEPHTSTSAGPGHSSDHNTTYSYKDSSGAYSISQKYLDRIPTWPHRRPEVASLINSAASPGALVLYKTPAFASQDPIIQDDMEDEDDELFASIEEVDDDEDTEMMELDDSP
ncbi:hypothetical protein FRB95_009280 [Tulasnella sp. JGI-2019a]|nr:hypothetical protein FRB93_012110 [Tulasnella sp. JGI-2019a]KAG9036358.1 hypothetical protein FRB95_009280 [Tulasnella sp. JGI-2019a]